jgi:hypothetical protein
MYISQIRKRSVPKPYPPETLALLKRLINNGKGVLGSGLKV